MLLYPPCTNAASLPHVEAKVAMEALLPELPRTRVEAETEFVDSFLVRGPRGSELTARGLTLPK